MKNNIEHLLFDIGGVFVDYSKVFYTASKDLNIEKELLDHTFNKYDEQITIGKISPQELFTLCIKENNLKAQLGYDFTLSWINDFEPIQETFDLVSELSKNFKISLISNIYKNMVPMMISKKLLPDIKYENLFLSCEIGLKKPDENIYTYALTELNATPDQILFIDDRQDFIDPAVKIGWNTYRFLTSDPDKSIIDISQILA